MINSIKVPQNFTPREHQLGLLRSLSAEGAPTRSILLWHRRAGKDIVSWVHLITQAAQKPGLYFYAFPTFTLAKKVIWNGIDENGLKVIDMIPKELISKVNSQDMSIHLKNGAIIQVVGGKDIDALRGTNPVGVVLSEYAWHRPDIWSMIILPILKFNKGWLIINSTPDGPNHYYDLVKRATGNPDWFLDKKTIDDTGLLTWADIQKDIDSGEITLEKAMQEYYVKFSVQASGSFYGDLITQARDNKRFGEYGPVDYRVTDTYWDLGVKDDTICWFVQRDGTRLNIIDYYESSKGLPISEYVKMLISKGYKYGTHYLPHDGRQRKQGINTIQTTQEMFDILLKNEGLGKTFVCKKPMRKIHGINATREMFKSFYFNEDLVKDGVRHLELYRRAFNASNNCYSEDPIHNGDSHASEAFALIAQAELEIGGAIINKHGVPRIPKLIFNATSEFRI